VYSIVDVYRHEIDDMLSGATVTKDEEAARQRQLKRCFNRDFTHAYQDGTSGDEMMSYERSNNRGQIVGTVLGSRPANRDVRGLKPDDRRRRAAIARIELFEPVGKGDLLELRHDNEFDQFLTTIAADDAAVGDIIECRVPRSMPEGCRVRVIRSQRAIDAAGAALKRDVLRRRAVDVSVVARLGEPFTVTLTCCDDPALTATATGFTVEAAKTRAVEASDLVEHVGRMGSSPFEPASFDVALDEGCGMGFSAVHKVRAAACKALEEAILAPYEERAKTLEIPGLDKCTRAMPEHYRDEPQICAAVTTLEAAEAARAEGATRIYMTTDALEAVGLSPADAFEQGIIPVLDEVCRAVDHERVDPWINAGATVAVGNISELAVAVHAGATAEVRSCLPVHNTPCMEALAKRGAGAFWLSPEITLDEIVSLGAAAPEALGITVFGRPRVMTSEHCILQVANGCIHDCANCRLRARKLSLKNIDGKVMPVRTDIHGRSRLYDAYPIDLTPQVPQLLDAGVRRLMVDGTLLETDEVGRAVARVRRAIEAAQAGRKPAARLRGATSGCMFVGIS
jgi:putative protease